MFSQASVNLSTEGVCVAEGGMCGRRAYMVGGMHGRGACMAGVCMAGGMHGRRTGMAGEMATAADGMHPTGMHSSFHLG